MKGLSQKLQAETAQGTKANQTNFAEKASKRSKRRKVNTRLEADGPDSVWFPDHHISTFYMDASICTFLYSALTFKLGYAVR